MERDRDKERGGVGGGGMKGEVECGGDHEALVCQEGDDQDPRERCVVERARED